ncbi:PRTase-like protein [Lactarius sanguifluus]|nr:PRTase-like protein [Lactarius sanguifluus]
MATEPEHIRVTYNEVHNIIKRSAEQISEFKPDLLIAIGGGGFFPARVLRTFLKSPDTRKNPVPGVTDEQSGVSGPEVGEILLGKRVLIVDEVDDSRKTLQYAVSELYKDAENALQSLPNHKREGAKTKFAVFVVHNKLKPKLGSLPEDIPYYVGDEVEDLWLDYPWEATDIEEHDKFAAAQKKV